MRLKFLFFIFVFLFLSFLKTSIAQTNSSPSITVINLVRGKDLGHEKDNLYLSLKNQWAVTKQEDVNATWLWQYGALKDNQMTGFAKKEMKNQEFGLLLEIDKNYAQQSRVSYRGQGPSYFSDGLFLVSYDLNERKKLIDNAFKKFKEVFGFYPKTVGAWWIGADSISYMQEKYGIVAVLRASDQYNLDVYTIWGTPWSIPYLPSKNNEGIPANSYNESSKVVILQWAVRDPVKGYYDSTYSIQDFYLKGYDLSYVDYLLSVYLKKPLDNLVIGLENGGSLQNFNNFYRQIIEKAKQKKEAKLVFAKDYAKLFLDTKQVFAGSSTFVARSFDSDDQSLWINTSNYRALVEKIGEKLYLSDLRDYSIKQKEDFYDFTNSQGKLWVGENYIIDSKAFPNSKKQIAISNGDISLKKQAGVTQVLSGNNKFADFSSSSITLYTQNHKIIYNFGKVPQSDNNNKYIFDKKQLIFFYIFPFSLFQNVSQSLTFLQIFPLALLPFMLFLLRKKRILFFSTILIYLFIYLHIPYFPLNKENLVKLSVIFLPLFVIVSSFIVLNFYKKKSLFFPVLLLAILFIFGISCFISRSSELINPFETNALQFIKSQKKNVIFVSQIDYSVKPIYKAVRPLIYDDLNIAAKVTGVKWTDVLRPQNHILAINNYKDKLIVVPRYLGSDLSKYEETKLKLTKIFDNYQIAIYKSNE